MNAIFDYKGYELDCTPRPEGKRFQARLVVTKKGFHPEQQFNDLQTFDVEAEAIGLAKLFGESWVDRKG